MSAPNIADAYPLSPMQEGLLFHSLYAPESGVYITQVACTLSRLRVGAFQQAWQHVVDRHAILRTAFAWQALEKPLQVVGRRVQLPLAQHDWRALATSAQAARYEAYLRDDRRRGFQLSKAPLMRLALFQMAEDTYKCVWSHHHVLLDGWSVPILLQEVFACYTAFCQGQPLHMQRPGLYRDYIGWLQQQDLSRAEAFWRQTLKGFRAPTPLGIDETLARVPSRDPEPGVQQRRLSKGMTEALLSWARQHQLTLNTVVQGAWGLLLHRYSGQDDVMFGATVSGRPAALAAVESMVGLFINTLPVRVRVSPEVPLLPWLQALQAQQVEMRQYEYSPLAQVHGWSDVPRGVPLFESILAFENYPVAPFLQEHIEQDTGLQIRSAQMRDRTHYPLAILAAPGAELGLKILYDGQRFAAPAITRLLGHLVTLLAGIMANPDQRLADVPLLTEAERHQQLVAWNETRAAYPQESCLHQLFTAQAARTPDAVAVMCDDQYLTYEALNHRANQLAHYLQRLGVGPEVCVGLCLERSLDLVVGVLGVLKAGGAYVPLDPTAPRERLAFMMADVQASVLLTQARLLAGLPEPGPHVVCLDTGWDAVARHSAANPVSAVTSEHLAYVIYTSGSTGQPKGVLVTHRNVVHSTQARLLYYHQPVSSFLLLSSLAFDSSVAGLFWTLCQGGMLVLPSAGRQGDPDHLTVLIARHHLSHVLSLPSLYALLLEQAADAPLAALRAVIVAGEACTHTLVARHYARLPDVALFNEYGPTEGTVWSSVYHCQAQDVGPSVPIGRPIANMQMYLLDTQWQPVPIGVPGELYIGGIGVTVGYGNRAALTAERFLPHPFSNVPGARLYRTGDLGRYRPDGAIEFLGRLDHQVKIRGFRIELGEIAAALQEHPAITEAIVVAGAERTGPFQAGGQAGHGASGREDASQPQHLVAYLVTNQNPPPSHGALRSHLQQKLPAYMVPSHFVRLEALPRTPNGKVDRRALPVPEPWRPESEAMYVAPRTEVQRTIATIWQEVLHVEKVGLHDNFFDLGGHSLLMIQICNKLRHTLHQDLAMLDLFQYPTIHSLATYLSQEKNVQLSSQATAELDEKMHAGKNRLQQQLRQRQ